MSGQSFIYGTIVLVAANLFNRSIGFIYQIAMMRMIHPEGVGLFNIAYPIYVLMVVVASLGIPVAISKLVAEEIAKNNFPGAFRIFKLSLYIIGFFSLAITLAVFIGAPILQEYIFPDPKVYYCFLALVPAIVVVSLCSAFRGYFQGLQMMGPTAMTQAAEQVIRITAGLSIAWFLLPKGVEYAAVGISIGVICGELAGFIFMLWIYYRKRPQISTSTYCAFEPITSSLRRIFNLGIPVTLTRFFSTFILSVEAILIPHQLLIWGMGTAEATATYGQFVGISETLLFTPSVITSAMATALVPAISEAMAQRNQYLVQNRSEEAVRLTSIVGMPMIAVFLTLSWELCQTLFGYGSAATALMIMAISGPFLYLSQTVTGILQGLGKPAIPFKNMILASVVKIAGIYYLVPSYGPSGAAVAMSVSYVIMSWLNYRDMKKLTNLHVQAAQCFLKPLLASCLCGIAMWQAKLWLSAWGISQWPLLMFTLTVGALAYLLFLFCIGGIHFHDFTKMTGAINKTHR